MICSEVGEFISALCDGETVPAAAAEHIGRCVTCGARLHQYLALGAEMRRVASLEHVEDIPAGSWGKNRRTTPTWWTKGWETMRIPRFAFALLVVTIVALGANMVLVRATAHTEGSVLSLKVKLPVGQSLRCALSLVNKAQGFCAYTAPPQWLLMIKVLSHNADQIELGIGQQFNTAPYPPGSYRVSFDDLQKLPEKSYWFRPGEKLEIRTADGGILELSGELTDHIPPFFTLNDDVPMDPNAGQLRVISPLLVEGEKVIFDYPGDSIVQDPQVVEMYTPGHGLWVLSLRPLEGAVEAEVNLNSVKFEMDGQRYKFVTGTPITREQHIWVLHDPEYTPSDPDQQKGFLFSADPKHLANSGSSSSK